MLPLELVERLECRNYFRDPVPAWFHPSAYSLTNANAEDKNCKRYNQPARSNPVVPIPAMLLRLPILRKGFRRPFDDPVVDGHRTDERKHNREDLDCESDCGKAPCRLVQVFEG